LQEAANRIIEKMNVVYNTTNNNEITSIEMYKSGTECDNVALSNNNHGLIFYENITKY